MSGFVEGQDRQQVTLLPESLDDFIAQDNAVRIVDAFVGELDLAAMGFKGTAPAATGRPSYHPGVLLRIYLYGQRRLSSSSHTASAITCRSRRSASGQPTELSTCTRKLPIRVRVSPGAASSSLDEVVRPGSRSARRNRGHGR